MAFRGNKEMDPLGSFICFSWAIPALLGCRTKAEQPHNWNTFVIASSSLDKVNNLSSSGLLGIPQSFIELFINYLTIFVWVYAAGGGFLSPRKAVKLIKIQLRKNVGLHILLHIFQSHPVGRLWPPGLMFVTTNNNFAPNALYELALPHSARVMAAVAWQYQLSKHCWCVVESLSCWHCLHMILLVFLT